MTAFWRTPPFIELIADPEAAIFTCLHSRPESCLCVPLPDQSCNCYRLGVRRFHRPIFFVLDVLVAGKGLIAPPGPADSARFALDSELGQVGTTAGPRLAGAALRPELFFLVGTVHQNRDYSLNNGHYPIRTLLFWVHAMLEEAKLILFGESRHQFCVMCGVSLESGEEMVCRLHARQVRC